MKIEKSKEKKEGFHITISDLLFGDNDEDEEDDDE